MYVGNRQRNFTTWEVALGNFTMQEAGENSTIHFSMQELRNSLWNLCPLEIGYSWGNFTKHKVGISRKPKSSYPEGVSNSQRNFTML